MTTIRNPIEWGGAQFVSAAHAASSFQRSIEHMQDTAHSPAPALRKISNADIWQSLRQGFDDFTAYRSDVLFLCATYALVGLVMARLAFGMDLLPLLFPLASGFAIIGPLAAVGLYEMSRLRERGDAARGVGLVSGRQVLRHMRDVARAAARMRRVRGAAARPFLLRRIEVDLEFGLREDDRADVAAFHHHAALGAERALARHEHVAHRGIARHERGRFVHVGCTDGRGDVVAVDRDDAVAQVEPGARGDRGHLTRGVEGHTGVQRAPRHGAIHRAGIDVAISQRPGDGAGHGALARTGRSVNGDHQTLHNRAV